MSPKMEHFSEARRSILSVLKHVGSMTIAELAARLQLTREAVRQHLLLLEHEGWIQGNINRVQRSTKARSL